MITRNELDKRLQLSLDNKIFHFVSVFVEFFIYYHGQVYLAWSGGKDSDVGCDIIDRIWRGDFTDKFITTDTWKLLTAYPKPPRVFCNTGLEFPEIVDRVKRRKFLHDDVVILKPKMGFLRVINEYGVAVGSKKIAGTVERLKKYLDNPSPKNNATKNLYLHGIKRDGTKSKSSKLPKRWMRLLTAPFKTSDKCCDVFKKNPFHQYKKETQRKAVVFTTTQESSRRTLSYMQTGCNTFDVGKEKCRPFSIFTDRDTWEYADRYGITFAPVYYERTVEVEQLDGTSKTCTLVAEKRTGCVWCGMGVHLEPKDKNNRIQRLAVSHPKLYDAVINKGGLGGVFEFCDIPFRPMDTVKALSLFNE